LRNIVKKCNGSSANKVALGSNIGKVENPAGVNHTFCLLVAGWLENKKVHAVDMQQCQQGCPRKQTSCDARGTTPTPSLSYDLTTRYSDLKVSTVQRLDYQIWKIGVRKHKTVYILFINPV
jgi:hypothetical protein